MTTHGKGICQSLNNSPLLKLPLELSIELSLG
jgi:hypothetical protein